MRNIFLKSIFFLLLNLSLLAGAGTTGKGASAATAGTAPASAEADKKDSLWKFASSAADVILYFNTRQPEEAMDKNLWKLIQLDKQEAAAEDAGNDWFDTKDRDIEAIANLYISSVVPFVATVEGVANITGNVQDDIKRLLKNLSQEGAPAPQINKKDGLSKYNFSIPTADICPPVDIMFVPVNSNQIQFRINITPGKEMSQSVINTSDGNNRSITGIPKENQAFVLAAVLEKITASPLMQMFEKQPIAAALKNMNSVCLYGSFQQRHLFIYGNFVFKDPASAGGFVRFLRGYTAKLFPQSGPRKQLEITVDKNAVQISEKINIAGVWQKINKITRPSPRRSSPVRK